MISHNHPDGIKGAQAVAACVFLAKNGRTKQEIREFTESEFRYDLHRGIDSIRPRISL
jgi:ADP-ribosyl-[dinitrogen reductase] hydrolase